MWISWKFLETKKIDSLSHTNEILGAYVTCGARLQLYSYLETLNIKALYCDTDSVFYVQPKSDFPLMDCGDNLGAMVNELRQDEHIEEFVAAGPKTMPTKL